MCGYQTEERKMIDSPISMESSAGQHYELEGFLHISQSVHATALFKPCDVVSLDSG